MHISIHDEEEHKQGAVIKLRKEAVARDLMCFCMVA
jgi:hypothetical protein